MSHICFVLVLAVVGAGDGVEAAKANNAFAVDLYRQLSAAEGNLFFSPLSLSSALAMAHAGAAGTTADEMAKVLHLGAGTDAEFGALVKGMTGGDPEKQVCRLDVANALWLERKQDFLKPFIAIVEEQFGADLFRVNFAQKADAAREEINEWVMKKTSNKIHDLIKPGQLDSNTRLVLTNAVYFKAKWEHEFEKWETRDKDFHLSAERKTTVRMMNHTVSIEYLKGDGYQVVSVPYLGDRFAMLIVLPDALDGLKALENTMTVEQVNEWLANVTKRKVNLSLPKFKATSEFSLEEQLAGMGMAEAFKEGADFSRMTGAKGLFISAVVHKAWVEVDEEGTEAAAATGIAMGATSVTIGAGPIVFNADHPFLYAIYDKTTGAVLFLGRMVDPTAGS